MIPLPRMIPLLCAASLCDAGRQKKALDAIVVRDVFTAEECQQIIQGASEQPREDAVLFDGKGGSMRNALSRDGTVNWLPVRGSSRWAWVLERMRQQLVAGEKEWGVRSRGLDTEGVQVARYGPSHHYDWHTDCSPPLDGLPAAGRVISVTVQLSSPAGYSGGEMELAGFGNSSSSIGSMVMFPSSLPHKVHRVGQGERYSIVAWFAGDWGDGEGPVSLTAVPPPFRHLVHTCPSSCWDWAVVKLTQLAPVLATRRSLLQGHATQNFRSRAAALRRSRMARRNVHEPWAPHGGGG